MFVQKRAQKFFAIQGSTIFAKTSKIKFWPLTYCISLRDFFLLSSDRSVKHHFSYYGVHFYPRQGGL